jgi:chaperonin GroEL
VAAVRHDQRSEPGLLFAYPARLALRRGIDCLADVIRPTLGPAPRYVAVANSFPNRPPELLDDAALILRRVVQLPDPYENMGAMLLRHTLWQVHKAVGDGTATTAVLLQAILRHTGRYLAAGGNPTGVRHGLEQGLAVVVAALRDLAKPLEGAAEIARVAQALCHDPEMATLLGEIFDTVGPDSYVQVEDGQTRGLEREYVEGIHWYEGFFSSYFITDPHKQEARLDNPAILISDLCLTTAEQLATLLDAVRRVARANGRSLMLIAQEVSGSALGLLVTNHRAEKVRVLAVKAPSASYGRHRDGLLQDVAILTGGHAVIQAAGERAQDLSLGDLGHARQAWATAFTSGVLGGRGDPIKLRQHISHLRAELAASPNSDDRAKLRERLGKLMGGTAILQVGAATKTELMVRKARAERAVLALGRALASGVVPGGGAAYLACQQALSDLSVQSSDEAAALKALHQALEEPSRVIAGNAGHEPARVVAQVKSSRVGWGLDARTGQVVDMWAAGILDPVQVLQTALEAAVSGAVMALTTDVLVHRRKPKMVFEP